VFSKLAGQDPESTSLPDDHALLRNYINFLEGCFSHLESGNITKNQINILTVYHRKLRETFLSKQKENNEA
jgi:hypothetical protein